MGITAMYTLRMIIDTLSSFNKHTLETSFAQVEQIPKNF